MTGNTDSRVPSGESPEAFTSLAEDARSRFEAEDCSKADDYWRMAIAFAPSPPLRGIAIRGQAECAEYTGHNERAIERAGTASILHEGVLLSVGGKANPEALRQCGYSASVLGRIGIGALINAELGDTSMHLTLESMLKALSYGDAAVRILEHVEHMTAAPDVYRAPALCYAAVAHALYGDHERGAYYSSLGISLGTARRQMPRGTYASPARHLPITTSVHALTAFSSEMDHGRLISLARRTFFPPPRS